MSRAELFDLLHDGLNQMNQTYDKHIEAQLIRFIELISQWNRVFNLTAIRDLDTMVTRHLLDSLIIRDYIKGNTVLDVGSGAGLPGIPLALVMPDTNFVLLDSNQKKTRFLMQTCYQLRLKNVQIVHENIGKYQPEQKFDAIVSRAFSTLPDFLSLSEHTVKPGGQLIAMKGVYPLTELQEINTPFKIVNTHRLNVPNLDADRHIVELIYQPEMETA